LTNQIISVKRIYLRYIKCYFCFTILKKTSLLWCFW